METKLAPLAFRHAETTRATGLVMMRALTALTWAGAALLAVAIEVAIGMHGGGAGRYVAALAALALLSVYAAAGPGLFARRTRAATASVAGGQLAVLALGHAAGWALVVLAVRG